MRVLILFVVVCFFMNGKVLAQHGDHTSEYTGQENRVIKSLSEDDVRELQQGKGWGFAKPAELNGFPGPSHVLEMMEELGLNDEQVKKIKIVFSEMNEKARELGVSFIDAEKALDKAFKDGEVNTKILQSLVLASAKARGELRFVHLNTHLKMMEILEESQIGRYNELRGYSNGDPCNNVPEGHDPQMWKKHNNCTE